MIIDSIDKDGRINITFTEPFKFNYYDEADVMIPSRARLLKEIDFANLSSENTGKKIFNVTY